MWLLPTLWDGSWFGSITLTVLVLSAVRHKWRHICWCRPCFGVVLAHMAYSAGFISMIYKYRNSLYRGRCCNSVKKQDFLVKTFDFVASGFNFCKWNDQCSDRIGVQQPLTTLHRRPTHYTKKQAINQKADLQQKCIIETFFCELLQTNHKFSPYFS